MIIISCTAKRVHEQRVMNNIVYELYPYKADSLNTQNQTTTFKLVIKEKEKKGLINSLYSPSNYNKLLFYANEQLSGDIKLMTGDGSTNAKLILFEPNMRMTNSLIFLIAFDKIAAKDIEDATFEYNDNLLNNGLIKFNLNHDFNL